MRDIFYQSAQFFYYGLTRLSMLIVPFQIAVTTVILLIHSIFAQGQGLWLVLVFQSFANVLFDAALIVTLYHLSNMRRLSMWRVWVYATYYFVKMLLATILTVAFVSLGLMLFIVPGIAIAVFLSFVSFLVVIEGKPVVVALTESRERTRTYFKPLLAVVGLQLLAVMMVYYIFPSETGVESIGWGTRLMVAVLSSYILVFFKIVMFRYYLLEQEQRKP